MTKKQLQDAVKKYGVVFVERGEDEVIQFFQVDDVSDTDGKMILSEIKKSMLKSFDKSSLEDVPSEPGIKRPKQIANGMSLYDMYKVQKEMDEENGRMVFSGRLIKVGKPIKVNIKLPEYRAEMFNAQSHNTGEMLFPVNVQ
jgi:hypothetical protein